MYVLIRRLSVVPRMSVKTGFIWLMVVTTWSDCLTVCLTIHLTDSRPVGRCVCLSVCLSTCDWSISDQPTFNSFFVWLTVFSSLAIQLVFTKSTRQLLSLPASLFLIWSKSLHHCLHVPRTDKLSYQRRTKTQNQSQQSREDPGNSKNARLRREYNNWIIRNCEILRVRNLLVINLVPRFSRRVRRSGYEICQ